MCGRFTLTHDINAVASTFQVPAALQTGPRYNVAPTQQVVTVMSNGTAHLETVRWGLIPSWAKEESIGAKMINARAETLAEKASFKRLLHSKRCLVVADGFYEWKKEAVGKTPMYITLKDQEIFAFAGLWDVWKDAAGDAVRTCTIITTEANEFMASIHDRMPAILTPEVHALWLDPAYHEAPALLSLLKPYATNQMNARPVSRLVNNPRYDSADLLS
ncbi:MAG: SOS response-associated peptidase [Chloroflexi bacterium]|nr:MAG: SOS response-associated peptidase [Chloroflexota bacterium]